MNVYVIVNKENATRDLFDDGSLLVSIRLHAAETVLRVAMSRMQMDGAGGCGQRCKAGAVQSSQYEWSVY